MDKFIETYCDVDDFCQLFIEPWQNSLLKKGVRKRRRPCRLSPAEICNGQVKPDTFLRGLSHGLFKFHW